MRLSEEEHQKRLALYEQGMSDSYIACEVGVSTHSILSWRRRNGLQPNLPRGGVHISIPRISSCSIVKQAEIMAEVRDDNESLFKDKKFLEKIGLECDDDA